MSVHDCLRFEQYHNNTLKHDTAMTLTGHYPDISQIYHTQPVVVQP